MLRVAVVQFTNRLSRPTYSYIHLCCVHLMHEILYNCTGHCAFAYKRAVPCDNTNSIGWAVHVLSCMSRYVLGSHAFDAVEYIYSVLTNILLGSHHI